MLRDWQEYDLRWLYGVQICVVSLALALLWSQYREINAGVRLSSVQWFLSVTVGIAMFALWINLDHDWATIGEAKGFYPQLTGGALDWRLVAMRIFGAAAVVPIMEELFWRSLVMRRIECAAFLDVTPAAVGLRAVVMSSVVFGLEHSLWFAGILAGLAYAWIYRQIGNLWAPIIAHSATNFCLGVWVVSTGNWQFW
jgi:hypothetical protein